MNDKDKGFHLLSHDENSSSDERTRERDKNDDGDPCADVNCSFSQRVFDVLKNIVFQFRLGQLKRNCNLDLSKPAVDMK